MPDNVALAKLLSIWPLDEDNADLLNEVCHCNYNKIPLEMYDLVVIGDGSCRARDDATA